MLLLIQYIKVITCIQEEPIHVFYRPYPNTCHSSVKPVLVTVYRDMYRYVHSLKYGAKG